MGYLGYVSIRVFDSDSIWCSCDIVEWEGDMNHFSINISSLFGIRMCCGSSIYDLTVTRDNMVILGHQFGVHLACFIGDLSVYWWGLIKEYFGWHMVEI